MPAAKLPENEDERLDALLKLQILDTNRTPEFDIFPNLASKLFSVPIAAISLIDDHRQWLKASVGLGNLEVSRDESFCAHTILDPSNTLFVPDTTKDPRFSDNPAVTGDAGLRFYAGSPLLSPDGHVVGTLCIADRKPRKMNEETVRQLEQLALAVSGALKLHSSVLKQSEHALIDPLTGLGNRANLDKILIEQMPNRRAVVGARYALLLVDLDQFGTVNDLFGHAGGDDALLQVAKRLASVTRKVDALGRLGEDKFYILMHEAPSIEALRVLGRRIQAVFDKPFIVQHQPIPLRTSIGIAISSDEIASPEALLHMADMAVLQAKRGGGGTTWLEGEDVSRASVAVGRQRMATLLRDALVPPGNEPFALALQPIFMGADGRLSGFEALVRWPMPNKPMLSPAEFIPTAEATGLVVQLDRWVLDRACQLAASWPDHLKISSNLSAANFYSVGLIEEVENALYRHNLRPDRLKLEITETVFLRNPAHVQGLITDLRKSGVQVVLDDFGSGHASLAYLRDYAFDGIKIDASFTAEIETSTKGQAFLRAIIDMAEAMGIDTTAEGVETDGQLRQLRDGNIKFMQGYLLGRPITPEQAKELISVQ